MSDPEWATRAREDDPPLRVACVPIGLDATDGIQVAIDGRFPDDAHVTLDADELLWVIDRTVEGIINSRMEGRAELARAFAQKRDDLRQVLEETRADLERVDAEMLRLERWRT